MTEKKELLAARVAAGGAVIVAGYFGINPPGFVAQVVAFAFGLAASSFFPVIIARDLLEAGDQGGRDRSAWRPASLFTAAYIIYFKFVNPSANVARTGWWGISPEGIGTRSAWLINFLASCTVVSLMTKAPPETRPEDGRQPALPAGNGLISHTLERGAGCRKAPRLLATRRAYNQAGSHRDRGGMDDRAR